MTRLRSLIIVVSVVALVLVLTLTAWRGHIGRDDGLPRHLVGRWEQVATLTDGIERPASGQTLVLNADGTGMAGTTPAKWKVFDESKLQLVLGGEGRSLRMTERKPYRIERGRLLLLEAADEESVFARR